VQDGVRPRGEHLLAGGAAVPGRVRHRGHQGEISLSTRSGRARGRIESEQWGRRDEWLCGGILGGWGLICVVWGLLAHKSGGTPVYECGVIYYVLSNLS
jgi:hypothetical protein